MTKAKMRNLKFFSFVLIIVSCWKLSAQVYEIASPDKLITVKVEVDQKISYSVKYKDKLLILPSEISIDIHRGVNLNNHPKVLDTVSGFINEKIIPVIKEKRAVIPDVYNKLIIKFTNQLELDFRVYDDGVAYRYSSGLTGEIAVNEEESNFNFQPGSTIYYPSINKRADADIFHSSFEEPYSESTIDSFSNNILAFSPVLVQKEGLAKILITESDVDDYPGMFLAKGYGTGLKARFAPYPLKEIVSGSEFKQKQVVERATFIAKTRGERTFPWRIIGIAPTDADILLNDLVFRLAPDPGFKDFTWIKPGKSTEEWITALNLYGVDFKAGLNTSTYKYYIDFAVRFGFEYVMLDAGWSDVNDLFKITEGMDMEEITSYAKQKGIGLILWTQALTIEKQMDQAMQQFKKWGIKIVMTDFIDRNDQQAVNFMQRFAAECAKNKFMCMIHGAPVPAGFSRTYPNMLAREGVLGSEYNIWSTKANPDHDLMLPFIRMFAGPMDYEPGILQNATKEQAVKMGFEKVIAQGTTMHQMAMFIVYESPLQLFSGNLSDAIREPELLSFIGKIPTTWDETLIFEAKLGKYILEARRNGETFYIAGFNNWDPKEFTLSLKFLEPGKYLFEIASDGINAARNPHDYKMEQITCTNNDVLKINLAPGGGYLARITKIKR